ncbi:nucleotidyltransferase family protein [Streptomyces sp. TRM 70361]|uniref:nucleotidyltransferase family protein n=1 Tax=Streptomyces sp. TRM 70361 TaxID=3116553 RepID=UPI002E7BC65F|nr:nucleotidyltransferase family protein [Streptomyces sp. TRM 70361]MEE1941032.1 nucleotidyltransferase family protein [Streptomyces sp. TRM 70361]
MSSSSLSAAADSSVTAPAGPPAGAARPVPRVAGLLLAAGGGRRLGGRPKALLPHRGRPLVEYAARVLRAGGCSPVHVVLGAAAAEVRERAVLPGCVLLDNPAWEEGMGSSLRAGLASLAGTGAGAAVVALVDQPGIGPAAVARLRAAHERGAELAAAAYGGHRGHPVLLGAGHWTAVARRAAGDRGARDHLREHAGEVVLVECGDIADPADVDTPGDLALLEGPPAGETAGS